MRGLIRLASILAVAATAALQGPAVLAHDEEGDGGASRHAVFVQTNNPAGNSIVAYHRNTDGTLSLVAIYPTGGKGGRAVGAAVDPLASQDSLVYDREHQLLLAVNAGSNTLSVFRVEGDRLHLNQVVSSGGPFPASIAVRGSLVYVLDAGLAGFVSGYRIDDEGLSPIDGSTRTLGLANSNPPFFLSAPAQVGFTPDGEHLIVTTKTNNLVDVFAVGPGGRLSDQPTRNPEAPVPFAFVFNHEGLLVLNAAGNSALGTFEVNDDGTLTPVGSPVSDTQAALCWVIGARGYDYAANTGSGTISQYRVSGDGSVTLVNPIAAAGIAGATDMATANRGQFLYVESGGSGSVAAFSVNGDGSLTPIQSQAVPDGANLEGIAAD